MKEGAEILSKGIWKMDRKFHFNAIWASLIARNISLVFFQISLVISWNISGYA